MTQENWKNLPKGQEMQIMMQYAEIGRKFTHAYLCTVETTGYCLLNKCLDKFAALADRNEYRTLKFQNVKRCE